MKETRSQVNQEFPFRKPLELVTPGPGYISILSIPHPTPNEASIT